MLEPSSYPSPCHFSLELATNEAITIGKYPLKEPKFMSPTQDYGQDFPFNAGFVKIKNKKPRLNSRVLRIKPRSSSITKLKQIPFGKSGSRFTISSNQASFISDYKIDTNPICQKRLKKQLLQAADQ